MKPAREAGAGRCRKDHAYRAGSRTRKPSGAGSLARPNRTTRARSRRVGNPSAIGYKPMAPRATLGCGRGLTLVGHCLEIEPQQSPGAGQRRQPEANAKPEREEPD